MMLDIVLFILGILLLFKGSDFFVDASVAIGKRARLSTVVVGGTLVSIATTSPELMVSIVSGINKSPGLAIGNALGSAAFNLGFILALGAIIRPFELAPGELRWRSLLIIGLTLLLFLLSIDLMLTRWRGLLLVAISLIYLFIDYRRGVRQSAGLSTSSAGTETTVESSIKKMIFFFLFGGAMVIGGSILLVDSGTSIAEALHVPPLFIGLTMVSVGTSLPELATALAAIRKRVFELSVGNIIGANVLNLTLITGAAASIYPLTLERMTQVYTFPAIFLMFGVFFLFVQSRNRFTRKEGIVIISMYFAFITGLTLLRFI